MRKALYGERVKNQSLSQPRWSLIAGCNIDKAHGRNEIGSFACSAEQDDLGKMRELEQTPQNINEPQVPLLSPETPEHLSAIHWDLVHVATLASFGRA